MKYNPHVVAKILIVGTIAGYLAAIINRIVNPSVRKEVQRQSEIVQTAETATAEDDELTAADIINAINKGFLIYKATQNNNGNYNSVLSYYILTH